MSFSWFFFLSYFINLIQQFIEPSSVQFICLEVLMLIMKILQWRIHEMKGRRNTLTLTLMFPCFYVSVIKHKSIILVINNVNKMLKEKTNPHPVIWFHYNQITNQCNVIELNSMEHPNATYNGTIPLNSTSLYSAHLHLNRFKADNF